jgi:hypothetical protein
MKNIAVKCLAILLGAGGALGMGMSIFMAIKGVDAHWLYLLPAVALLFLFYWSAISGLKLWRNDPQGWKWAPRLYTAQIPIITVPGLTYQYYTGVYICIIGGQTEQNFTIGLGANANFFLATTINSWAYGINLFAVIAAAFLWHAKRQLTLGKSDVLIGVAK